MKSFELQTYKNGKWTIRGVFADQDLALVEARQCVEGDSFHGVRVVEEYYNEANNKAQVRTVFSGGLADNRDKAGQQEENAARRKKRRTSAQRQKVIKTSSRAQNGRKSDGPKYIKITLILFLIVMAGLAALAGLQEYFLSR
jgi:hypothetical protein